MKINKAALRSSNATWQCVNIASVITNGISSDFHFKSKCKFIQRNPKTLTFFGVIFQDFVDKLNRLGR